MGEGGLRAPPLSPPTANRAMHAAEAQRSSHTPFFLIGSGFLKQRFPPSFFFSTRRHTPGVKKDPRNEN